MLIKIPKPRLLPKSKIVPVVKDRPNLRRIDLTKVQLIAMPSNAEEASTVKWAKLVAFMEKWLRKGFVTFGMREWQAIFFNREVDEWLKREPASNPWKMGNGGLIGFPDGLLKTKGGMSYDVALWNPTKGKQEWHMRIFGPEDDQDLPYWYNYLRLAVYPLN